MRTSTRSGGARSPLLLWPAVVALATVAGAPAGSAAQDSNILQPVDTLERRLEYDDFEVVDRRGSRGTNDRTNRVAMSYPDGTMLVAKWALAPSGGEEYSNNPRYELAAYQIQKLFLAPHEYVVPPTVLRAFPVSWYRDLEPSAQPTFRGTQSVLVVIQYWLFNIAGTDFWDEDRFASDTAYARNMANFNIFTYLISHNDQNQGNYLISGNPNNPRIFSVDNGVAFESALSDRGARWRRMRVDRLPSETIERLQSLTEDDVRKALETVAQFRVEEDGTLSPMPPEPATHPGRGIRQDDGIVQLGLTTREIDAVWRRLERLLSDVEDGDYELF